MAYNEDFAIRVSNVIGTWDGLFEKKMFGEMIHSARKFVEKLPAK